MAITVDTKDLVNYPGITKRVTLDLDSVVPYGYEGDEQIVMTVSTTAYSDNVARTAIQDLYITDAKLGWIKSSGFKGSNFQLDSTHNELRIKLDTTVSGWDGSGWYKIVLDHNNGANIPGSEVADDMEDKIRALPTGGQWNSADAGFELSYKNASVEFENGKFKIISGMLGDYLGTNKSSVAVASGTQNDCLSMLGFDLTIDSETLAGTEIKEAQLTQNYPYMGDYTQIYTGGGIGAAIGDAMAITDGSNTEYFIVQDTGPATGQITVTSGTITNSYTSGSSKVQKLRLNDPDFQPTSVFENVDDIGRYGIKYMVNQIDYSS